MEPEFPAGLWVHQRGTGELEAADFQPDPDGYERHGCPGDQHNLEYLVCLRRSGVSDFGDVPDGTDALDRARLYEAAQYVDLHAARLYQSRTDYQRRHL